MKAKIHKNIRKYETKSFFMFTTRQAISVSISLLIVIAICLVPVGTFQIKTMISMVFALPVAMTGFVKITGLYLNDIFKKALAEFINKADYRPFKHEGYFNEKK